MTLTFNDGDGAQALEHNQTADRWRFTVVTGCSVSPGTNDMTLQITAGAAIFDGTRVAVAAQDNVALNPADSSNPRKDVAYLDTNGDLQVSTGTPEEAKPTDNTRFQTRRPAPNDLSGTDAVVVAEVWVADGASDITSSDIRDRRQLANLILEDLDAQLVETGAGLTYNDLREAL